MTQKTIKAWAVMNEDEHNGFEGILWTNGGRVLAIFSEKQYAEKESNERGFIKKKVIPCEIKLLTPKKGE